MWRRAEDDTLGSNIQIDSDPSVAPKPFTGQQSNPSSRRDAVAISFWCEHCLVNADLVISQHKGVSILNWEYTPDAPPSVRAKRESESY